MDSDPLTCPVCMVNYDLIAKTPHIIPKCGHTMCSECIQSLLKKRVPVGPNYSLKCPFCNKDSIVYKDYTELPKNFALVDMIDKKRSQNLCMTHSAPSELVCLTCRQLVCVKCAFHSSHREHQIEVLDDFYRHVNKKIDDVDSWLQKIDDGQAIVSNSLAFKKNLLLKSVNMKFENYTKLLDEQKEKVIREIESQFSVQNAEKIFSCRIESLEQEDLLKWKSSLKEIVLKWKRKKDFETASAIDQDNYQIKIQSIEELLQKDWSEQYFQKLNEMDVKFNESLEGQIQKIFDIKNLEISFGKEKMDKKQLKEADKEEIPEDDFINLEESGEKSIAIKIQEEQQQPSKKFLDEIEEKNEPEIESFEQNPLNVIQKSKPKQSKQKPKEEEEEEQSDAQLKSKGASIPKIILQNFIHKFKLDFKNTRIKISNKSANQLNVISFEDYDSDEEAKEFTKFQSFNPARTNKIILELSDCLIDQMSSEILVQFINSFKEIKSLKLKFSNVSGEKNTLRNLFGIFYLLPNLEQLNLKFLNSTLINDQRMEGFSQFTAHLRKLKSFDVEVRGCQGLKDQGMYHILDGIKNLSNIEYFVVDCENHQGVTNTTLNTLANIIQTLPLLKDLEVDFSQCQGLGEFGPELLFRNIGNLKNIENLILVFSGTKLSDRPLNELSKGFKNLEKLKHLQLLCKKCHSIQDISVFGDRLKLLNKVQVLDLSFEECNRLSAKSIAKLSESLATFSNLQLLMLDFDKCHNFDNTNFGDLSKVLEASSASLQEIYFYFKECDLIVDSGFEKFTKHFGKCTKLQKIILGFKRVTLLTAKSLSNLGKALSHLTQLDNLQLGFEDCDEFTNISVQDLLDGIVNENGVEQLYLILSNCNGFTDNLGGLIGSKIQKLKNLETLEIELDDNKIGDQAFKDIAEGLVDHQQLEVLRIYASHTKCGSQSIKALGKEIAELKNLKELVLNFEQCNKMNEDDISEVTQLLSNSINLDLKLLYDVDEVARQLKQFDKAIGSVKNKFEIFEFD